MLSIYKFRVYLQKNKMAELFTKILVSLPYFFTSRQGLYKSRCIKIHLFMCFHATVMVLPEIMSFM